MKTNDWSWLPFAIVVIVVFLTGCCTSKNTIYYNSKTEKCKSTRCTKCIDIHKL